MDGTPRAPARRVHGISGELPRESWNKSTRLPFLKIFAFRQEIGWRCCPGRGRDNSAFGSISNFGSASLGRKTVQTGSKLSTTTELEGQS